MLRVVRKRKQYLWEVSRMGGSSAKCRQSQIAAEKSPIPPYNFNADRPAETSERSV
jgi:hypothetical protein